MSDYFGISVFSNNNTMTDDGMIKGCGHDIHNMIISYKQIEIKYINKYVAMHLELDYIL